MSQLRLGPVHTLIRGFRETRLESLAEVLSYLADLSQNAPIHISPLFPRWEMTSPVLMTIIQKQQHRQETAWEPQQHNGYIVSQLNVSQAAAWRVRVRVG